MAKLLFYCDWKHLKETGRTITGLTYLTYPFGPLPETLNNALINKTGEIGEKISYIPAAEKSRKPMSIKHTFNEKLFTRFELKILEEAIEIFRDADATLLVKASHWYDQPWTLTRSGRDIIVPIDEKMAFSGSDAKITYDEYVERQEDLSDIHGMLYGAR